MSFGESRQQDESIRRSFSVSSEIEGCIPWRVEGRAAGKEHISEETDDSESEPWYHKPVVQTNEACGKPRAGETAESISPAFQKSQNNKEATLEHFFATSPHNIPHLNDVYDMVRKAYERPAGDPMKDLNVNVAIWGIFMNATLRAAIHLGNDHDVNLRHVKNSFWRFTGQLFGKTEKVDQCQTETTGISLIDSKDLRWISTSLLHSRAFQYDNAKVYVFSDSVLCLGEMGHDPGESWNNKIHWYLETNHFSALNRIVGSPMEFEWKIFPGFTTAGILEVIQKMMGELQCDLADFKGRIIFMSMFNDIVWNAKGNEELCENDSKRVEEYARRFPRGHWSFHGPGSEKKWYGTYDGTQSGSWTRTAEKLLLNFAGSGHPIFRCTSAKEEEGQQYNSQQVTRILSCS